MSGYLVLIEARQIKALLRCAGDDPVRPYLNGVFFDPAGFAVATDGHMLMAVHSASFSGEGFTVPRDVLESAIKHAAARATLSISRTHIHYCGPKVGNVTAEYSQVLARFPEWQRAVPRSLSGEPAWFDCELLERARKASVDLRERGNGLCKIQLTMNGYGPAVVQTDDTVLIVIMPMRTNAEDKVSSRIADFLSLKSPDSVVAAA